MQRFPGTVATVLLIGAAFACGGGGGGGGSANSATYQVSVTAVNAETMVSNQPVAVSGLPLSGRAVAIATKRFWILPCSLFPFLRT